MPTERLYYAEPYLRDFTCQVLQCNPAARNSSPTPLNEVITDVTAFYPNSGGQPSDRGTLGGADVVDVIERGDEIIHLTVASVPPGPATGRVDIERRFDHMQQHTGQHILSGAFSSLFGLDTVGFHLGDETVTIDLNAPDVSYDQTAAAERLACEVIFQNRPINAAFWGREAIDTSRLRKMPTRTENIRLVDITGFDLSPCGGTHTRATGEVGLIKITRTERIRGTTRVEFVCGRRALADYRWKNDVVHVSSSLLSVHGRELADAIDRLQTGLREARKEAETAADLLRDVQASQMYDSAEPIGSLGIKLIVRAYDGEGIDHLKALAHRLCERPLAVALLGSSSGASAHLVFEKSHDVPVDVSNLLRQVLPTVDGKGGGTQLIAQGGGRNPAALPEALSSAAALASRFLEEAGLHP
ncbi:MAG: DHHA1 domain-containing protein [Clostridia bacterium]|nr:DHHA1 domain-containing protein [Clostridia bacterium]